MTTQQMNRQRAPRSIIGPNLLGSTEKTVAFKEYMVENNTADKVHADRWIKDAEYIEGLASRLRVSAKHVYDGTKPAVKEQIQLSSDELAEKLLDMQKKFAAYQRQTEKRLAQLSA